MTDFGHAIGIPATSPERNQPDPSAPTGQRRDEATPSAPPPYDNLPPYENPPAHPYGQPSAPPAASVDLDLAHAHAQARARAENGDLTGARTMLEEALAAGELRLGSSAPALVPLMVDVATLARRLGNLTEAANQLRRAYGIAVASHGPQHPTSLSIEGRLAAVLYRLGESTEAYDWHLADAGRRVLGDEHPAVRGAQQRLAALAQAPTPPTPTALSSVPSSPVTPSPVAPSPAPPAAGSAPPQAAASPPVEAAGWTPPTDAGVWTPPTDAGTWTPPTDTPGWAPPNDSVAWTPPTDTAGWTPPPATPAEPPVAANLVYEPAIEGDVWEDGEATVRTRRVGGSGSTILVASLGAVILAVVVVVALALLTPSADQPTAQTSSPGPSPITVTANPTPSTAPTSPAPTAVRIVEDAGGTVTLAWSDPSPGTVPFLVSGARDGDALVAIQSVPAGETTTTIYGLNVNFNYCFSVAAVYSADVVQESMATCTRRENVTSAPTE